MRSRFLTFVALLAVGCAPTGATKARSTIAAAPEAAPGPALARSSGTRSAPELRFIENDIAAATAKARAEGKALFVDAWAPWCHTCLSMRSYVLSDPALRPLADRIIFAALDTDRPESAAFLERHVVKVWPTFFVIDVAAGAQAAGDSAGERVVGYWRGSASVRELQSFIEEGLRQVSGRAGDASAQALVEARAAQAAGDGAKAAAAYERALQEAKPGWPDRSTALLGLIEVLYRNNAYPACARAAREHLPEITGASMPADASLYALLCAKSLPAGDERAATERAVLARLEELTAHPGEGATIDDRADALDILSEARKARGDEAGARAAQEQRLALMEAAARAAASIEEAQTFDYGRANAYIALGRADEAIRMLEQREEQMPGSYEPPARLASALLRAGRFAEARAAVERALAHAYGPRRVSYLKLRAEIQRKLGDAAGELATLREEVSGYEALPPGHASPERLADARARLAAALARAASDGASSKPPR